MDTKNKIEKPKAYARNASTIAKQLLRIASIQESKKGDEYFIKDISYHKEQIQILKDLKTFCDYYIHNIDHFNNENTSINYFYERLEDAFECLYDLERNIREWNKLLINYDKKHRKTNQ